MKHKSMIEGSPMEEAEESAKEEQMEHETNRHIDTLHDAHKIIKDPEKMQRVHKVIKNKHSAIKAMAPMPESGEEDGEITSIKGIREKANKKAMPAM